MTFSPTNELPLVHELTPVPDSVEVFRRLASRPHCVFFDSAQRDAELGRYSFIAADPFDWITATAVDEDPLQRVETAMALFESNLVPGLPPFQGGAAGLLGYELGQTLERIPAARHDEFKTPALAVGLYDTVVAFDHEKERAWILSHGFPEQSASARKQRARQRIDEMLDWLASPPETSAPPELALSRQNLAPQFEVAERGGVTSDFTREAYLSAVARAVEYIHAGDIFQVNLSQRILTLQRESAMDTYVALRRRNPAPFAGYLDLGKAQVASASPERFLATRDRSVETRPIKGTRHRAPKATEDRLLAEQLRGSEKDRAENVMIVDLMRNDLARVCEATSVDVPALCQLESYRHVHHLVSVVTGTLAEGFSAIDLLRASFPGGSITGAPKIRSMEIIAELEPTARGPYCGSLCYLGYDSPGYKGAMDSSILIRTLVAAGGWLQASVGGGIVADSDPAAEYEETWHKAAGLLG